MVETYSTRQLPGVVDFLVKKVKEALPGMPEDWAVAAVVLVLDLVERSGAVSDDMVVCTECDYLATEECVDSEGRCEDCTEEEDA